MRALAWIWYLLFWELRKVLSLKPISLKCLTPLWPHKMSFYLNTHAHSRNGSMSILRLAIWILIRAHDQNPTNLILQLYLLYSCSLKQVGSANARSAWVIANTQQPHLVVMYSVGTNSRHPEKYVHMCVCVLCVWHCSVCRSCIMEWCNEKPECPLCRTPLTHSSLVCLYHSDF